MSMDLPPTMGGSGPVRGPDSKWASLRGFLSRLIKGPRLAWVLLAMIFSAILGIVVAATRHPDAPVVLEETIKGTLGGAIGGAIVGLVAALIHSAR